MKALKLILIPLFLLSTNAMAQTSYTDDEIKQKIISESIQNYPGNCPCPYNHASNGYKCGKRSAWSRAGGYVPICYKREISNEQLQKWKQQYRER